MEKLYYKEYFQLERNHWWFKARLELIESVLLKREKTRLESRPKILNVGAATGATSLMLKKIGDVVSLEYDKECCEFLESILKEEVINASLTELPFENNSFDLVCAFDVIEHIKDDDKAINEINRVLKKDGLVYITVPAFKILWSRHDEINHHFRRYNSREIKVLLEQNGFELSYNTYFNFFLFIPIFLFRVFSRLIGRRDSSDSTGSDFETFNYNSIVNKVFYKIFKSEIFVLSKSFSFPFGVSYLAIGKKK